jgi:hypothetical protein
MIDEEVAALVKRRGGVVGYSIKYDLRRLRISIVTFDN